MGHEKTDILIVGSGVSSLTAAILLLRKGLSVRILEAHYKAGGYMHSFDKLGHTFDSGAHYVGALEEREPFWALLNYLDVYDENVFTPLNEESFDTFYFKDQKVDQVSYGKGYERVIDHFCGLFPKEKQGILSYFAHLKKVARNFPTYEFLVDYDQQFLLQSLERSLKEEAESHTQDPELLNALYAYCGLHGVMPKEVSFGLHSIIVDSLIRSGGYGFRGSGDALVKKFVGVIGKLGGEIVLNSKVTGFEKAGGKITSVVTHKKQVFAADQFIFSGHPKDMLDLVGEESFRKPYINRIQNTPESVGILGLYGVADRKVIDKVNKNYYHINRTVPEELPNHQELTDEPFISFMTFPDREVKNTADEIAFSVHAPQYYTWVEPWKDKRAYSRDKDYQELKEKMAESLFNFVDGFGFEFKEKTLRYETSTSLTNKRFNLSPNGSAYGIYHSIPYTGARALSARTKIENLFVTGQNTLFPGIMAASIAGMRTVGFMYGIKEHISGVRRLMDS